MSLFAVLLILLIIGLAMLNRHVRHLLTISNISPVVPIQRPILGAAIFLDIFSGCADDGRGVDLGGIRLSGEGASSVGVHVTRVHSRDEGLAAELRRCELLVAVRVEFK
jgi:hypothetical protein